MTREGVRSKKGREKKKVKKFKTFCMCQISEGRNGWQGKGSEVRNKTGAGKEIDTEID